MLWFKYAYHQHIKNKDIHLLPRLLRLSRVDVTGLVRGPQATLIFRSLTRADFFKTGGGPLCFLNVLPTLFIGAIT